MSLLPASNILGKCLLSQTRMPESIVLSHVLQTTSHLEGGQVQNFMCYICDNRWIPMQVVFVDKHGMATHAQDNPKLLDLEYHQAVHDTLQHLVLSKEDAVYLASLQLHCEDMRAETEPSALKAKLRHYWPARMVRTTIYYLRTIPSLLHEVLFWCSCVYLDKKRLCDGGGHQIISYTITMIQALPIHFSHAKRASGFHKHATRECMVACWIYSAKRRMGYLITVQQRWYWLLMVSSAVLKTSNA